MHFIFCIITVAYWLDYWDKTQRFVMPAGFQILHDPNTDVRPFLTNAADELEYLKFVDQLSAISQALSMYSTFAGLCVLLFVCRILKSLDFQERMGLVTRTIEVVNLFLCALHVSYACLPLCT
jgi:hypothetical protein